MIKLEELGESRTSEILLVSKTTTVHQHARTIAERLVHTLRINKYQVRIESWRPQPPGVLPAKQGCGKLGGNATRPKAHSG